MWEQEDTGADIHIRDSLYGTVTGSCRSGTFLMLENGQEAFAKFGGLDDGTQVFCTVRKKANDYFRMLVTIDSILDAAA